MGPDDRIGRAFKVLARPGDPRGVLPRLATKRRRRRIIRSAQAVALAGGVVAASVAGAYGLGRLFERPDPAERAAPVGGPSTSLTTEGCPRFIPFEPTYLPEGFAPVAVPGPAPGAPPAESGQFVVHYTNGAGLAVEIRRPGTLFTELALADDSPTVRILGSETPSFGPVSPGGDRYIVHFEYPASMMPNDSCDEYSLNEYGLDLDELLKVARGLQSDEQRTLERAQRQAEKLQERLQEEMEAAARGAFDSCPNPDGSLRPGPDAQREARDVALEFARAELEGDQQTVLELSDPAWLEGQYGVCCAGNEISAYGSVPSAEDGLVGLSCGLDIESRSWRVAIDDGSESASLDTWLYLIRREGGWKVWGSY